MPVPSGRESLRCVWRTYGPDELVGRRRIFLAGDARVVRVPEQRDVRHRRALEDFEQRRRVGEVAVRFDDHADAAAFRMLAERAQPVDHARHRRRLALRPAAPCRRRRARSGTLRRLARSMKRRPSSSCAARTFGSASCMRDEAPRSEILRLSAARSFMRLIEARADELRPLRQIHLAFDAAQLDRGIAHGRRLLEDARPRPFRAAERREADGKLRRTLPGAENGRRAAAAAATPEGIHGGR